MSTKLKPGKFDCYKDALNGEEMFVLLARDAAAPAAIEQWCQMRIATGMNKPTDLQITEARECAARMELQRDDVRAALKQRVSQVAQQRGGGSIDLG